MSDKEVTYETETVYLGKPLTVKTTVTLPEYLVKDLKMIADSQGISFSEAVRQAIELDVFIRAAFNNGGSIYLQKEKNGPLVKVQLSR